MKLSAVGNETFGLLLSKKINQNIVDQISPIAPGMALVIFAIMIYTGIVLENILHLPYSFARIIDQPAG